MLKLYPAHLISGTSLTVYEDDTNPLVFYAMPCEPGFRTDPKHPNQYVINFIKYLMPVDRPDGLKGGGFLIFDSVFVISDADMNAAQQQLNQLLKSKGYKDAQGNPATAQISMPSFTKGSASLTLLDSGGALVQKIEGAGKPSLLGQMICSFTAELSPEGAAVVEGALQGKGGIVQIAYDLTYTAALPPVTGTVWFNAVKFASFYQTIDKSGSDYWHGDNTEQEKIREAFISADCGSVTFDFTSMPMNDPTVSKLHDDLVNWGWQQLNVAVQSVLGQAGGGSSSSGSSGSGSSSGNGSSGGSSSGSSSAGVTGQNVGSDLGQNRGDDGMEHVTRDESSYASFSFWENYSERDSIAFETVQQGTLPNPPNPQQYMETINANDPFFAQIHATMICNADFQKFNIVSVDANCQYTKSTPNTITGLTFKGPNDVLKFDSDTANGDMTYQYQFNVNYADQSKPYVSPVYTTQNQVTTLDVGTMGVLYVNLNVSNVDWTTVKQVQVAFQYPDTDPTGAAISREFAFDTNTRSATLVVVLLKAADKKYTYTVTYVLNDGTQVTTAPKQDNTQDLFINDIFVPKTVTFIAEGDFVNEINNIFLRMTYTDSKNNYAQSTDYQFSAQNRTHDWTFLVIPGANGQVSYTGVVSYNNQTQQNIPPTTSTSALITFGPPDQTIVTVTPDPALLDFTQVRLVQIEFQYSDPANNLSLQQEIVLKSTGATPPSWTFYTKDPSKTSYTYTATYYMATTPPSVIKQPAVTSSDTDLVLSMPTAPAATT
ncbi:MAG TPA: hypothetical protein VMT95_11680 [Candidatus Binatia bacterium]|nr:hypothetical protein [Candidatus Binatia bacterium]